MKFTKKLLVATLATSTLLALAACSEDTPGDSNGGTGDGNDTTVTTYDVAFNSGTNGSYVQTQTINEGGKVTKPADPTHSEGNPFIEWEYQGSAYNFNTTVTKDMTLDAVWGNTSFTVNFSTGYESDGLSVPQQTVVDGQIALEPTKDSLPYRTGYEITGWTSGGVPYDFDSTVSGNLSLTAIWSAVNTYTVTLDTSTINESLDVSVTSQKVNEGRTMVLPSVSLTSSVNSTDILNGWMYVDSSNSTFVEFDTSAVVTSNVTLIPNWKKAFSSSDFYEMLDEKEVGGSNWTLGSASEQIVNPYGTDANDKVIKIGRIAGSTTSNQYKSLNTIERSEGNQFILSFDIRGEDTTNTAMGVKIYANGSTSSNAEVARIKINGTSSGGANVQWSVYGSKGWVDGTFNSFSFANQSLNTNYRIRNDQWYTVQVVFEYIMVDGTLELGAKMYLNGVHLSNPTYETNGYLIAVPAANSIFENGATTTSITGINFTPDSGVEGTTAGNVVYINNFYVDNKAA